MKTNKFGIGKIVCFSAMFLVCFLWLATDVSAYPISGWTRLYEGVETASAHVTSPREMRAFAVRINLKNPYTSFYSTPGNGSAPRDTTRKTTTAFRSDNSLEAAVNTNFFSIDDATYSWIYGLLISQGNTIATDYEDKHAQVRITADKIASVVSGGNPSGIEHAFAGSIINLKDGVAQGVDTDLHPRTTIGVSQDGIYLILVVIDGRQPGWSNGATVEEAGLWAESFGAYNAINADGGGSSCLVTKADGVLNRPSDGSPRAVGANFGVQSKAIQFVGPSSVSRDSDHINVVTRGHLDGVYSKTWTNGSGWADWNLINTNSAYDPAITSWGANRLDVFNVGNGTDKWLWHKSWISGSGWSSAENLGTVHCTSGASASTWGTDRLDVVVVGDGGNVRRCRWNGSNWNWTNLGAPSVDVHSVYNNPAIVSRSVDRLEVFVCGGDNKLWHRYTNDGGSTWSDWSSLGAKNLMRSSPSVCSWGTNRMDVVCRDDDNEIFHKYWISGTGWSNWLATGKITNDVAQPCISARAVNKIDLFYRGLHDDLKHVVYNGSTWGSTSDLGPYFDD